MSGGIVHVVFDAVFCCATHLVKPSNSTGFTGYHLPFYSEQSRSLESRQMLRIATFDSLTRCLSADHYVLQ